MQRSQLGVLVLLVAFVALAGCSRVQADWKSAQAADTTAAYEQFLTEHPDSAFSPQARLRLKQLAEDHDWQLASTADTLDAYEQFVAQHADGKWAQEARVRIENLQLQSSDGTAVASGALPGTPGAVTGATSPAGTAAPAGATSPAVATAAAVGAAATPASKPAASAAPAKTTTPAVARSAPAAKPAAKPTKAAATSSGGGGWSAQLGAFSSKAHAEAAWQQLRKKFPAQLGAYTPGYHGAGSGAKHVYRLQVATGSEQKARELCAKLKAKSQACVTVRG